MRRRRVEANVYITWGRHREAWGKFDDLPLGSGIITSADRARSLGVVVTPDMYMQGDLPKMAKGKDTFAVAVPLLARVVVDSEGSADALKVASAVVDKILISNPEWRALLVVNGDAVVIPLGEAPAAKPAASAKAPAKAAKSEEADDDSDDSDDEDDDGGEDAPEDKPAKGKASVKKATKKEEEEEEDEDDDSDDDEAEDDDEDADDDEDEPEDKPTPKKSGLKGSKLPPPKSKK